MEGICLNLLEATVTLYPANPDGTPQLGAPLFSGAPAENLRGLERWLKKETTPSGAKYPRKHPLVAQYDITIGRLWALPDDSVMDWSAAYTSYVLDIVWVEEETQAWHRKTFYGVTINEHGWDAKDVESGLVENQQFDAQYLVPASGTAYTSAPPIPATLPYRVIYTGADGVSVLLYTYDPTSGVFTGQAATTGRAVIVNNPFALTFAGDSSPAVAATTAASLTYRSGAVYRNANSYRQNGLAANGIFAEAALPGDRPRLDFYYGSLRTATITQEGIFDADFIEGSLQTATDGEFSLFGGGGALVGVLARGNLTATQIQVAP